MKNVVVGLGKHGFYTGYNLAFAIYEDNRERDADFIEIPLLGDDFYNPYLSGGLDLERLYAIKDFVDKAIRELKDNQKEGEK